MKLYIPILVLAILAFGFAAFSVTVGTFAGPKRWNKAKLEAYECGIEPTPIPLGGGKIPVNYYVTAMLFIVFDIETVYMIPWAVAFQQLKSMSGVLLLEMLTFVVILGVGYVYVWKRGALQWD